MTEYIVEKKQTSGGWTWAEQKGKLIRCKDCKYWYAGENINYCRKFWDDDGEPKLYRCTADDYCSRAERKEEWVK